MTGPRPRRGRRNRARRLDTPRGRSRWIGIDPRHGNRILERFYRVDKSRSRRLGSTGLGLAIVRNVAAAHDGDVRYESVPGHGTEFRVRLPLADVEKGPEGVQEA